MGDELPRQTEAQGEGLKLMALLTRGAVLPSFGAPENVRLDQRLAWARLIAEFS